MNSKNFFKKSIATVLSVVTLLTIVSPCTSAKNNLPDKKNTSGMSTVKKVAIGVGAIALGLAAFMAYEHYKPVYVDDLSEEDQERWNRLDNAICRTNVFLATRTNEVKKLFDNDSNYKNPKLLNAHTSIFETTLLMDAADQGLADICEILIEHGAHVNIGYSLSTPLHDAACCRYVNNKRKPFISPEQQISSSDAYVATCKCLIRHGANVNAKTIFGQTPLHQAVRWGTLEVINLLIDNGANIHAKDNLGQTPLHDAFFSTLKCDNLLEVANLLIDKGADITAKDNRGHTPFHTLTVHGYTDEDIQRALNKAKHNK